MTTTIPRNRDEASAKAGRITRPVLRYHGGKWRIASWIISHFPEHKIYVEPYCGAASILLRKPRAYNEVINDLDKDVVALFWVLRDPATALELCRAVELTPFSRCEFEDAYERRPNQTEIESARQLVVRSFMGFGSSGNREYITGFRAASKQQGRPHSMDWANLPEALHAVTERLKGVTIECKDALSVMRQQDSPDTLFYVDPPYLHSLRNSSATTQYQFEMTAQDHVDLARCLKSVKGKVVLSGYAGELYSQLYSDWRSVTKSVRAASNVGSCERTEVLWMNFAEGVAPKLDEGGSIMSASEKTTTEPTANGERHASGPSPNVAGHLNANFL